MGTNGNGLTTKQRIFIEAYLSNGFNATDAARQAKYKHPNVVGPQNLVKPSIRHYIDERLKLSTMTADEVLAKEDEIARFDVSKYLYTGGRQTGLNVQRMIDDGYGHLIRGIKHTQQGTTIEWASPDDARDRLLRAYGAYRETKDVSGSIVIRYDNDWRNTSQGD